MTLASREDRSPGPAVSSRRARRIVAAVLAGLFAILLPIAITAAWVRVTILSTSGYVAAVTPLAADPAVRAAVRTIATAEIGPALSKAAVDALPSGLSFAADPLGTSLANVAGDDVSSVMASHEFRHLWQVANASAHTQLISVLDGHSDAVATTGGHVVLNLVPMVNAVLMQVSARLSALTGRAIKTPAITSISAADCERLSHAAHAALPSDCGQLPLFPATTLSGTQHAFRALKTGTLALLLLTPSTGAAALLVTPRRRRTLVQLSAAASATVLAAALGLSWLLSTLASREPARYKPAIATILRALTSSFFSLAWWHVAVGLITAATVVVAHQHDVSCSRLERKIERSNREQLA